MPALRDAASSCTGLQCAFLYGAFSHYVSRGLPCRRTPAPCRRDEVHGEDVRADLPSEARQIFFCGETEAAALPAPRNASPARALVLLITLCVCVCVPLVCFGCFKPIAQAVLVPMSMLSSALLR